MKKLYIAALGIMGALGLQAQTFTLSANNLNIDMPSNQSAYAQTVLTNVTASTVDFRYDLITETLNAAWDIQFCDPNSCFVSPRQTDDFQLAREASAIFKLEVNPNGVAGSAIYQLKVYPINNPSEVDTITWNINSVVGMDEASFGKHVTLYPNPVQDQLHIASSEGALVKGNVQVYDLSGKLMLSSEVKPVFEMSLDVANLAPGMYNVRYTTAQGSVNKKFMKGI